MSSVAHWNDASFRIAEHYRMGWTTSQYLLLHLVGGGLSKIVGSTELACRILLVGLAVAWVQSCRALLGAFHVDRRLAIMSAPLFWNRALVVGFLPYVASLPLLFAVLALFVRVEVWTLSRAALLAVLGILVFYTHASAFSLLAAITVALAVVRAWPRGGVASRLVTVIVDCAWLAPASLFAGFWLVRGRFGSHASSIHDPSEIGTMNPIRAIKLIALYAHDTWTSHVDDWLGIGFWIVFLALLAGSRRAPDDAKPGTLVPLVVAFVVYLLTPFRVGAGVFLNVRMAPVLAFFALLGLRPARGLRGSLPLAIVPVLSLVQCIDNVHEIRVLQRDVEGLPELLANVPRGARLVTLNFSGFDPFAAHFTPWVHVGSQHRASAGGVASFSFSELTHWSVQYRPESAPPRQQDLSWGLHPCFFRNERDGAYFDYVLARGAIDPFATDPPGPRWRFVGRTEKYSLYEKDRAAQWIAADGDRPDPGPCP